MEPNETKKPKITENRDYDEDGEYDPRLSPEQRMELLKMFNQHLTDKLGDGALPYLSAFGNYLEDC